MLSDATHARSRLEVLVRFVGTDMTEDVSRRNADNYLVDLQGARVRDAVDTARALLPLSSSGFYVVEAQGSRFDPLGAWNSQVSGPSSIIGERCLWIAAKNNGSKRLF